MFTYQPEGVCSRKFNFDIEDGVVKDIEIEGGCAGNLLGIMSLLKGVTVDEAIDKLEGIRCGQKDTSCPDQIAKALSAYKETQA